MPQSKPYKNKPDYDPGRFRYLITFVKTTTVKNPSGGTTVTPVTVFSTKSIMLPVKDGAQAEIELGASNLNGDQYFVIRSGGQYAPDKAMRIEYDGKFYKIVALIPQGQPQKYWKILGIKTE